MSRRQQREHDQPSARSIILRFVPYMRKRWKLMAGSSTAMFVEVGLRLLEPWPLKFIFDATLHKAGVETTGVAWLDRFSPLTFLTFCAASLVVIVAARAWAAYLRRVGFALAGNLVLTDVRGDLFAHIQRLSLSFHSKRRTGDLATRLTSDIGRLQEVVSTAVLPLAAHILTVLGVAVVMLLLEWRLALVAFATLPLFWMSTKRLGKQIRSTARRERQRHGEMGAIATEAIGAIGVVQSLGGEDTHNSRFGARNLSSLKEGVRGKRLSAQLLGAADVFIALGTAILLWAGAWLVMKGELQLTTLLVFFFYHKNMTRPIRNVTKYSGRTAKALASAERIVEILDTVPLIVDTPHATDAPETVSSISFSHVSFGYEPEQTAVEDVSFEARVGAATVFVGPSGAGKSTLMNLLLRLYDPSEGTIAADGQDIHRFRVASWRSRIAVVPQEAMLFATTVRDNITAGQQGLSDAQIIEAATLACAHEFIARLPEGYDTVVGERGATLSQGQRQRIAIARALVRRAPIIVLDEPTASLDRQNTDDIVRAIRNLAKEHVCFVITHDLRTVAPDDQVIYMQAGTIRERGSHEELVARGGKYTGAFVDNETAAAACEVSDA